ncbi:MAG: hypothetical protein GF401_16960 [Chitinivibrionales bacterium]|nr:hypothetical protein [Chitinivibrionales bacterium]
MIQIRNPLSKGIIVCVCLLTASCGIFTPRQDEEPLGPLKRDPLNFKAILDGTGDEFNKEDFEEMLHENFIYRTPVGETFYKTQMVIHIEKIMNNYGDNIGVEWKEDPDHQVRPVFDENDSVMVYRRYSFSVQNPSTDSIISFSGKSEFTFAFFQQKNTWTILEWYDIPDQRESFFDPNSPY